MFGNKDDINLLMTEINNLKEDINGSIGTTFYSTPSGKIRYGSAGLKTDVKSLDNRVSNIEDKLDALLDYYDIKIDYVVKEGYEVTELPIEEEE